MSLLSISVHIISAGNGLDSKHRRIGTQLFKCLEETGSLASVLSDPSQCHDH